MAQAYGIMTFNSLWLLLYYVAVLAVAVARLSILYDCFNSLKR